VAWRGCKGGAINILKISRDEFGEGGHRKKLLKRVVRRRGGYGRLAKEIEIRRKLCPVILNGRGGGILENYVLGRSLVKKNKGRGPYVKGGGWPGGGRKTVFSLHTFKRGKTTTVKKGLARMGGKGGFKRKSCTRRISSRDKEGVKKWLRGLRVRLEKGEEKIP